LTDGGNEDNDSTLEEQPLSVAAAAASIHIDQQESVSESNIVDLQRCAFLLRVVEFVTNKNYSKLIMAEV